MYIVCCDECGAVLGDPDDEIEDGQVLQVKIEVTCDDGLLNPKSPCVNNVYMFCSAKCALKYLNEVKKIEDEWMKTWEEGKILGKKKIVPIGCRKERMSYGKALD